eukprot:scaffold388122_cov70-Cyclotella_meneghiniana.AAC.1
MANLIMLMLQPPQQPLHQLQSKPVDGVNCATEHLAVAGAFMSFCYPQTLLPPSAHSEPHLPSFAWSNLQFVVRLRRPNRTPGMKVLYEEREGSISGLLRLLAEGDANCGNGRRDRNHTTIQVAEWMLRLRNTTATQPHSNQSGVRGMFLFEWLVIKWSRSQQFVVDSDCLLQCYKSKAVVQWAAKFLLSWCIQEMMGWQDPKTKITVTMT